MAVVPEPAPAFRDRNAEAALQCLSAARYPDYQSADEDDHHYKGGDADDDLPDRFLPFGRGRIQQPAVYLLYCLEERIGFDPSFHVSGVGVYAESPFPCLAE